MWGLFITGLRRMAHQVVNICHAFLPKAKEEEEEYQLLIFIIIINQSLMRCSYLNFRFPGRLGRPGSGRRIATIRCTNPIGRRANGIRRDRANR